MKTRTLFRAVIPLLMLVTTMAASAAQAGQATLSWTPPATYTDGSPMTAPAGYKVHIGTTSCSYRQHIDVGNVTSYTAQNLTDGAAYYFAITAYDTSGAESPYSKEIYRVLAPAVTHTITATAGSGGSITAEGNGNVTTQVQNNTTVSRVTVTDGANQLFTITSQLGYIVADVLVDGSSVGGISSYTFSNVTTDHTLSATFAAASFTIVATAGTGGSISPSGSTTLPAGSNQSYSIVPAAGFTVADVKVDGVSKGPITTYSFSSVTADHTIEATFASTGYTITATAASGGSIAPSGSATVTSGSSQTYTITPAAGYSISDVKVDGVSVGAVSTYTFSDVSASHTIEAAFVTSSYTITASAGSGGSITPAGPTTVPSGGNQTFAIAAAAGYGIADVLVDGASVGAASSYTFNNVTANHSIQATFSSLPAYTITATAGAGGTITPSGAASVASGGNETFTIAPSPGYSVADVKVDGASVGAVTSYTFSNVTGNHSIDATFSAITYTITASAGAGGSIAPSGGTTVASGGSQSFTITPLTGYNIADVKVDGVSVGTIGSYTFNNVSGNHTIEASFRGLTYTITASAGAGGSISPSGTTTVAFGGGQSYAITASTGYRIAEVKVDGASVGAAGSYSFANVTANHTIETSFSLLSYTITASAGAGGTITPAGSATVTFGSSLSYAITPAAGYRILDVKVDGASVGALSAYTFGNVTANHTIDAAFGVTTYSITASAGTGGSITPAGSAIVSYGGSQTYSISAAAGYSITDVKVDNVSIGPVTSYTFTNVAANHTIQASFAATTLFAVNSGGPLYKSSSGVTYLADSNFSGGSVSTTRATISGTTDGVLYQSSRIGSSFSYRVPLANGSYSVTLKFAETQFTAAKRRTFNVAIGGTTVISNLDIYAKVGGNAAYDVTVPATVTNGSLTITFTKRNANATVSAIRVALPGAAQGPATGNVVVAENSDQPPVLATAIANAAFALLWQRVGDWNLAAQSGALPSSAPPAASASLATTAPGQKARQSRQTAVTTAAEAVYALPADRGITWNGNVGVLGDIPERTSVCATVAPSGGDDTAAIQSAIDGCGTDQVVALQSGTFTISRSITVKSDVTLRGAGMGSTIIKGAAGMGGVYLIGFNAGAAEGASVATTALAKGSSTITTTAPHGWTVGNLLIIDQLNNPNGDPVVTNVGYAGACFWCGRASGTRSLGQIAKVIDIPDATTATLEVPLYWNYAGSLSPQATRIDGITTRAGVEDMTVDNSTSASSTQANDGATLVMYGASNCWFLRVEAVGSYETMLRIKRGYRNTIRSCRLHEGTPALPPGGTSYDTSRAYGIWINPGSSNLIENNLLYHLTMPVVMNSTASGNVVAYNYITDLYYVNMNWNIAATQFHGGHPFMNLVEGNYQEGRVQPDYVWGSSSHNTVFRNRVTLAPGKGGAKWDVDLAKGAQYYNIIGNVLGTRGFETVYMFENTRLTSAAAIYRMGYVTDGDNDAAGNDPRVALTALLQGNWDSVNDAAVWNGIPPQTLPASMYLTGQPSWWGAMPWPAVGPDVTPMYPAAPGMCNGMPWDDRNIPSSLVPAAPGSVTVQ